LYTLHGTTVNMTDFAKYIEVDIRDRIRDKKRVDPRDLENLQNITESTVFSKR
jgi:hypothetical protein